MSLLNSHWLTSTCKFVPEQTLCKSVRCQSWSLISALCFLKILLPILPAQFLCFLLLLRKGSNKLVFTEEEINHKAPNRNCAIIITLMGIDGSQIKRVLLWGMATQCPENPTWAASPLRNTKTKGPEFAFAWLWPSDEAWITPAMAYALQWILTAFVTVDYQTDLSYPVKRETSNSILLDWCAKAVGFLLCCWKKEKKWPIPMIRANNLIILLWPQMLFQTFCRSIMRSTFWNVSLGYWGE